MNFHDIRMPQFIESFAIGRSGFATSCVSTLSGREVRNLDREYSKQKYLIKNCRLSSLEFEQFSAFFRARRGSNFSFRFRDHLDYQATTQIIATGDGKLQQCQLTKTYEDPIMPYSRVITKPVLDSCEFLTYPKESISIDLKVNYNSEVVNLEAPLEIGHILIANYLFEVEVRFGSDSFEYHYASDGSIELAELELLEVI
ncbi:TIGR02217 family protein [Candidatus Tisiphia endosymbiont of Nemotelus uliginosus]|uniref:phage distal tail protein, Rcc01695 family n=1 Tax=Candidatus Tisiphia endosymbiont of Nemotelus uliginosus TaxID=3077926 RepID=UPI0035C93592